VTDKGPTEQTHGQAGAQRDRQAEGKTNGQKNI